MNNERGYEEAVRERGMDSMEKMERNAGLIYGFKKANQIKEQLFQDYDKTKV